MPTEGPMVDRRRFPVVGELAGSSASASRSAVPAAESSPHGLASSVSDTGKINNQLVDVSAVVV